MWSERDLVALANLVAERISDDLKAMVDDLVEQIADAVIARLQVPGIVKHAKAPGRYQARVTPQQIMLVDGERVVFQFKADGPAVIHAIPPCCDLKVSGKPVAVPYRVTSADDVRVVLISDASPELVLEWEELGPE